MASTPLAAQHAACLLRACLSAYSHGSSPIPNQQINGPAKAPPRSIEAAGRDEGTGHRAASIARMSAIKLVQQRPLCARQIDRLELGLDQRRHVAQNRDLIVVERSRL